MAETVVLGLGNILLQDEGVGVRVIERLLEQYDFSEEVQVVDGGTQGLDLLPYIEDASHLLVVDAVQARKPPGTLMRLTGRDIPVFLDATKISPHQEGLQNLLAIATLKDYLPEEIVLWGVQIGELGVGLELTPPVAEQLESLVQKVLDELRAWGVAPCRKSNDFGS